MIQQKALATSLLQSEENIREGFQAMLDEALSDLVSYMEVTVSPALHCKGKLNMRSFTEILLDELNKFNAKKTQMKVNLVLNVNVLNVTPVEAMEIAKLAVEFYGKGVIGFSTSGAEISNEQMHYWESVFIFLQKHFIPVNMFAGEENVHSVATALVEGHARRISGGFQITESDHILTDVTAHNVGVICTPSKRFMKCCSGWKKSPVRFFYDFGLKVAYGSFHHSFTGMSRSDQLYNMAEEAGLDAISLLRIISNSFESCFLPYAEMKQLNKQFWIDAEKILKDNGFSRVMNYEYF